MNQLEAEVKQLIVDELSLEDVTADDIDSNAPLFGAGLGLDSIDALELAMALSRRYGVKIDSDSESARAIFASVAAIAAFVAENGTTPTGGDR